MTKLFRTVLLIAAIAAAGSFLWAQVPNAPPKNPNPPFFKGDKGEKEDPNGRIVQGVVKNDQDNFVDGAVVKLKNTKTLQVRSFITKADGKYRFGGLNKDVDYEVQAGHQGKSSDTKTVSVFDSRKQIILNLKLEEKSSAKN